MVKVLNIKPPNFRQITLKPLPSLPISPCLSTFAFFETSLSNPDLQWKILKLKLNCRPRHSCFFSGAHDPKQEQARKMLESALGEKKSEFDKWNKEIKKREDVAGGGDGGGGGWFGGGRWFGGSDGERFWKETQQASLAVVGIIFMYLMIAKGEVILAVIFNSLLFVLRGTRNSFQSISSAMSRKVFPSNSAPVQTLNEVVQTRYSAKESVIRKWGMD